MANKNEVIISTEEYKELISKGVPNGNEKMKMEKARANKEIDNK